ncbi:MAG: GAF domain-containing protein [candidate division KSB1 bacterium]|nr:GAF domain-containing protein [candidate division KSB1 bacterium]
MDAAKQDADKNSMDFPCQLRDLCEELKRNKSMIKKLSLLSETDNVLLSESDNKSLEQKFDFIVEKATEILDAELCTLWLVDDGHIYIKTSYGIKEGLGEAEKIDKQKKLPIISGEGTGLHGHIAFTKKPHNLTRQEIYSHPATRKEIDTSDFLSTDVAYSSLNYPILDETNELLGLICAYNKRDEGGNLCTDRGFSDEFDAPLMQFLTMKLLIAIKNAQLVKELDKYRRIIEATPDPVVVTTLDGTMTYMNKGAIEVFGDIRGKRVKDYYLSDEVSSGIDKAFEVMRRLNESPDNSIKDYETKFIGKNGEPVTVSATFSLFKDVNNKVVGTIGIVKDLRKTKRLIEVGNSLLSMHEVDKIFEKISEICLDFPHAIRAYVRIYDESTQKLKLCALKSRIEGEEFPEDTTTIETGVTGYVFQSQKPFISPDLDNEPAELQHRLFKDTKSKLAVPINRSDPASNTTKTFGVIYVDSQQENAFSINDMYYLSTLATQAAAAIENANLIAAKTKIITELTALEKIQEAITTYLDVDMILRSVLEAVVDVLKFDYATISKVETTSNQIGTIDGKNVPDEWLTMAWHPLDSNDIQAWVVRTKKEIKLTGWDDRLDKEIFERFNHQNLVRVYLPILSHGIAFGTLEAGYQKEHRQDITESEIDTLRKVVRLAGIGIDQAYMRKEQSKLLDQLEKLNYASVWIQSSRSQPEAIRHIFDCLARIGYPRAILSLISESSGKIEGRYASGLNWKQILRDISFDQSSNTVQACVIRERRSLLVRDCASDPRCDPATVQKAQFKSQYVIPLLVDEKAIGALQIDLTDKQGLLNGPEEVLRHRMQILETFACQIATGLRNVKNQETINLLETTLTETAHEFRSPLHNIITQIGGLKSYFQVNQEKSSEINEIFKIIAEEAHRAKRQMENTLMFTDRSRGLIGFNFEKGFIQDVIQNCVSYYRLRALQRGISIQIRDNVKKLPAFYFDRPKIEQVIINLVDNAVKYSHDNRYIRIQGFDDGSRIHIEIWDKGLGIPEHEYENIFKGFRRGSPRDQKRYIPGTGLGLKISKEIVEGHGGQITVRSTPFLNDPRRISIYEGYDTIFTVILPKTPQTLGEK